MRRLIPWFAVVFIRLVGATLRIRHVRSASIDAYNAAGRRYILSFWHAHLMFMLQSRFAHPIGVISSKSKDGDISAGVFRFYGVECVRGSSSKGGTAALRELIRMAKRGRNIVFTPDGPKGPARVLKPGVVSAAQATGLPVIPIAFAAAHHKLLRSWDRMVVPMPFSKTIFLYGEPIEIPRDGDVVEWSAVVEKSMNDLVAEAESRLYELWNEGQAGRPAHTMPAAGETTEP
jgi:lysophospholipid acyltransferase (LPLAT)-like uncharacterized protein